MTDTIFALASGPAPSGVAIVRVSGPAAAMAIHRLAPSLNGHMPPPRAAVRATLYAAESSLGAESNLPLDDALVIWFPGPASFTGEDVAEFHVHGSLAVIDGLVRTLAAIDGTRPAEAGEFTRRAFLNAKIDLTAAEGLADLVAAETEQQRRQALRQLRGELGELCASWAAELTTALAHLEAAIDFSDEDLPDGIASGALDAAKSIGEAIGRQLADGGRGERIRQGLRIAIIGAPNAGKSTLLNRLARRDAAIVSATAGTTRDVIEVHLDIGGYAVIVADTAGLRGSDGEPVDEIEAEGIRRTHLNAADADMRLAVVDSATYPEIDSATKALIQAGDVVAFNKIDLYPRGSRTHLDIATLTPGTVCTISAAEGRGLDDLEALISDRLGAAPANDEAPPLTRARHRVALTECRNALVRAREAMETGASVELISEDLRLAVRALGRITGRVDVEDLLDVIFRDFCIGK